MRKFISFQLPSLPLLSRSRKRDKIVHQSTLSANGPPVSVRPRPDSAHSALARRDTIELVFEDGGRRKREEEEKNVEDGENMHVVRQQKK